MSSTQKSSFSSAKRVLATAASAAMIFALLPAGIALGESPDNVCPPPDGAETFPDVDTGVHADNIECAAGYDIVDGYPDGEYKPGLDVFRAQMATFIVNTIEAATGEAMPAGDNAFDDDDSSVHHANINKLAAAGIVQGQGGDYNPARKVNRANMATFIANAIDYVDDQDPANNSVLPAATTDHFTDDETSVHEENINRLADAGIVEGQDSPTLYNPAGIVFRGQMASFVIQAASELEEQGLWAANDDAPVDPTTNQELPATPSDAAENTVSSSATNSDGARQYTVSGLDSTKSYDIFLFPSEDVTVDANDVVTFEDDDGTNSAGDNEADWAATDGDIEVVNGTSTGDTNGTVVDVSPVNGTINFTIDSTTADSVIPVVIVADTGSSDTDPDVDLDADNKPTEDFGVGGVKTWIPAEAGQGGIGATDEEVTSVSKDLNRFITADGTYYYDSNDLFYIADTTDEDGGGGTAIEECDGASDQVTLEKFEAELSKGDQIDEESVYQPDEALSSSFCLEDLSPAAPTMGTVDEATDSGAEVTLTGVLSGATVTAYCEDDNTTPGTDATDDPVITTTDTQCGQSSTDADATESGFQLVLTGLSADTTYEVAANQTIGDETSPLSAEAQFKTAVAGAAARPILTDAKVTTDTGLVGVMDTGDVWTLTFDQGMATTTASDGQFVVEDPDGDRYQIDCDGQTISTTDRPAASTVDAECVLSNSDKTLTIYIQDDPIDSTEDLSGTSVGDNQAEYAMTITSVSSNVEDKQNDDLDLANSTDKVVDKE